MNVGHFREERLSLPMRHQRRDQNSRVVNALASGCDHRLPSGSVSPVGNIIKARASNIPLSRRSLIHVVGMIDGGPLCGQEWGSESSWIDGRRRSRPQHLTGSIGGNSAARCGCTGERRIRALD